MRLENISIKNFRSIESTTLEACGGFNVLIGKNNSGKSSILYGIYSFFECLKAENVVTIQSPIGRDIDFFQRKVTVPIAITFTFSLSLAERDAFIRDIVTEAPQMKNAADGLDPSLQLSVTVNVLNAVQNFSYVSRISLVPSPKL